MTEQNTDYSIAFIDTEIEPVSGKILDIGSVRGDGGLFHKVSLAEFISFLNGMQFVCGHNIFNHDLKFIGKALCDAEVNPANIIDTLFLSPLLFPTKPYHSLLKDDKLQSEEANNPLNDSIKARDLFNDEVTAFKQIDEALKQIFYLLLRKKREFSGFFRFIEYESESGDILTPNENEYLTFNGQPIVKFSLQFSRQIENLKEKNHELKSAKLNFVIFWQKEETKQEIKIILPELYFERRK